MALPAEKTRYTFADVLSWDEDERIEIIDGEAFMMATPSRIHQEISGELFRQLANFLEGKQCRVYPAPFGVRLFARDGDGPEDVDKLDQHGCKGAPEMVIEILSPSTLRHDRLVKLNLYDQAGVLEYWIVDPQNRAVQVFRRDGGAALRICEEYGHTQVAKVSVLDGCFLELSKVFPK